MKASDPSIHETVAFKQKEKTTVLHEIQDSHFNPIQPNRPLVFTNKTARNHEQMRTTKQLKYTDRDTITPPQPLHLKLNFFQASLTKTNEIAKENPISSYKSEVLTAICRSISRLSNRSPDFFETTGSSGASPDTAEKTKKKDLRLKDQAADSEMEQSETLDRL